MLLLLPLALIYRYTLRLFAAIRYIHAFFDAFASHVTLPR